MHTLLEHQRGRNIEDVALSHEGLSQKRHIDKDPHNNVNQVHHSRLLTKKQISDLTLGIRELSKKLAQLRLQLRVRNVFILTKANDEKLIGYSSEVTDWLLSRYRDINVYGFACAEYGIVADLRVATWKRR